MPPRNSALLPPTFRPRPRAARKRSSMARFSTRRILQLTSSPCPSSVLMSDPGRAARSRVRLALEHGDTLSMSMPAMKAEAPATAIPTTVATAAPVVTMTPKRTPRADKYAKMAKEVAAHVVPPLTVLALLMLFWELVCRRTGSTLPPPSRVFKETKELIFDPFFDRGGIDKGLFRHLSASLQLVALGYFLAGGA